MSERFSGVFVAVLLVAAGCSRDFQLPVEGDGPIADLRAAPDPARAGVDLMIEFTTSSPPTGDPVVEIAGRFASKLSGPDAENRFGYRLIPAGDEPEGQETPVTVTAILGQEVRATTTVTFDFTPPELISSTLTPPIAASGETITVTLDADEILSAPEVSSRGLVFDCLPESEAGTDQRFLCTATPTGTEIQGPYALDVLLRDLAGNETTLVLPAAGELRFGNAPVITDLRATPLIARAGDTVSVEFVADRPLAAGSRVHLGSMDFLQTAETELTSGWAYTYTHVLTGAEPEGLTDIEVLAEDIGGATRSETFAIELDFTSPMLAFSSFTATRLGVGGSFDATVVGNEALSSVSGSVGFPAYQLPMRCLRDSEFAWICHYDALGLEPEETPLNVALVLEDLAGNTALATTDPVEFDFTCTYPGTPIRALVDWRGDVELIAEAGSFEAGATVEITDGAGGTLIQTVTADAAGAVTPISLAGVSEVWVEATDTLGNACAPLQPVSAFRADSRGYLPGSGLPNPSRFHTATLDQRLAPLAGLGGAELGSAGYRNLDRVDGSAQVRSEPQQAAGTTARWFAPAPPATPSERYLHAGTYHPALRRFVVTGGRAANSNGLADTWAWDGHEWSEPTSFGPPEHCDAQLVYSDAEERAFLFSGRSCEASPELHYPTMWSLGTEGWRQESLVPGLPPPMRDYAAAYDPARQEIILTGGSILNAAGTGILDQQRTYRWNGAWQDIGWAPEYVDSAGLVFDRNGLGLHFGGRRTGFTDILNWSFGWDGSGWTDLFPANNPPPREDMVLVYDSHRRMVVMYGGRPIAGETPDNTVWEWDGTTWAGHPPVGAPPPTALSASAAGYDERRGRTVVMGGDGWDGLIYWEVYEYGYPWRFPFLHAHLEGRNDLPATLGRLTVSVVAAGTGASLDATGIDGVRLLLWDRIAGDWDVVASNATSSLASPEARLDFTFPASIGNESAFDRYFDIGTRSVEALILPAEGATHLGGSSLEVDALWLTLDGP